MISEKIVLNRNIRDIDNMISETLDCREGCLLDSYIAIDKDGKMFIALERYETSRSSGYTVITSDNQDELWNRWSEFTEAIDAKEEVKNG